MSDCWNYAPPTRPGDCVASISKDENARRHWNGTNWSAPWYVGDPPDIVSRARNTPAEAGGSPIAWVKFADDSRQVPSEPWINNPELRYTSAGTIVFGPHGRRVAKADSPFDAVQIAQALNFTYVTPPREAAQC